MRQFQKRTDLSPHAVPVPAVTSIVRGTMAKPATYQHPGGTLDSCCVNCAPKYCIQFLPPEIPATAPIHAKPVCPTDAIHFDQAERRVQITDACVKCGLCALRCPYGAIFLGPDGPDTNPFDTTNYQDADATATAAILNLPRMNSVSTAEIRKAMNKAVADQRYADKSTYYPLVGRLLTSIGLCTVVTRAGDTNNRMDAVILDPVESVPIEVKSPTETYYVNVKAVRQAVENKIVMTARSMFPTKKATSTLAIGYEYPNTRSDVDELIDDVAGVYGINVGIVSLETLFIMAWNRHMRGDTSGAAALKSLKGRAHASIS
jgi:ferredoxin